MILPHSYGEVPASCAGEGVMSRIPIVVHDPSARYAGTSPFEWGGILR